MRTKSLTVIQELSGKEICGLYMRNDGGLAEHGAELKTFLEGFKIVNGIGVVNREKVAFGMGCLAAQIIAHFAREPGSCHLCPPGTSDSNEDYLYTIYHERQARLSWPVLSIQVRAGSPLPFGLPGTRRDHMPIIYNGSVKDFDPIEAESAWRSRKEVLVNDFSDDPILSAKIIVTR